MVLFLLHITLTKTALAFFTCSDPLSYTDPLTNEIHEHRFLSADARIECYTGSHFMWAMTLGLGMLVVYALGIPLFAFLVLRNIKHDLAKWQATYGFLYSAYEPDLWYWEVFVVFRKVAFATAAVLMRPVGVDLQVRVTTRSFSHDSLTNQDMYVLLP